MKQVNIYTDGACRGNPGPGGWGAILVYGTTEKEMSGGERTTTNNRMELTAVIAALSALREPCTVTLTSETASKEYDGTPRADGARRINPPHLTQTSGQDCSTCWMSIP